MNKEWLSKKERFETLDARQENPGNFLPFVSSKAQALPEDEGLHIIQNFEPVPLYHILAEMGFEHETIQGDVGEYHVYFYKLPTAASKSEMLEGKSLSTKMGGHLNLKPERIEAITALVQDFYAGELLDSVRQRFETEVKSISAIEFAFVEQKMTELGVSDSQFKSKVEDLIIIFKKSLKLEETTDYPAGHPIHSFKQENVLLLELVDELREVDTNRGDSWWQDSFEKLWQVHTHYVRKENQLFPLLEQKGFDKPSKVMWALHDDVRRDIKKVRSLLKDGKTEAMLKALPAVLDGVVDMTFKESKILWPTSLAMLDESDWLTVRKGEEEIGYCLIDSPPQWPNEIDVLVDTVVVSEPLAKDKVIAKPFIAATVKPSSAIGAIGLEEGYLTPEQISLILQYLPIDISFINEFDDLKYVNHEAEPRANEENILTTFKAGTKDAAESWGEEDGRFIHKQSLAIRDDEGNYKGVLELKQDITEIRVLEGEQRILDWE